MKSVMEKPGVVKCVAALSGNHSPDAGKMAALEAANRELVEALVGVLDCIQETRGPDAFDAVFKARAILAKHKATQ